jgi:hypothetical protein
MRPFEMRITAPCDNQATLAPAEIRIRRRPVIARSDSDEAIHFSTDCGMDCFAPLAMTAQINPVSRRDGG